MTNEVTDKQKLAINEFVMVQRRLGMAERAIKRAIFRKFGVKIIVK